MGEEVEVEVEEGRRGWMREGRGEGMNGRGVDGLGMEVEE